MRISLTRHCISDYITNRSGPGGPLSILHVCVLYVVAPSGINHIEHANMRFRFRLEILQIHNVD
jgi:hypothetical protein